ncbi:MAG: ATP-binding protein [Chloroflexi bacterium]|nr:ATP-binding protein [Chloroflexota bacterium]
MADTTELNKALTQATTVNDLGIPASIISDLILRLMFNEGDVSVSRFAEVIRVHTQVIDETLAWMQQEHLVEVAKAGTLGRLSYTYRLTDEGGKRARDAFGRTQYVGPAPVSIEAYNQVILQQTGNTRRVAPDEVKQAISHLILPDNFHRRIGPAINSGSSLFLYGPPGNGKTTVAQAIAGLLAGTDPIWIPYALTTGGQIIQVFDPLVHVSAPVEKGKTEQLYGRVDKRWGLFVRPAVMVGGELKMDALDLRFDQVAKFYEAPLQLKANGGMFLIDDFGRQQVRPQDLLNRWIVPLESRIDFLRLQTGQTLDVPFRQLIVFSTNLDPAQLVDAAFLRRIQMKVEVSSPDEKMFYQIFVKICEAYNVPFDKDSFVYLLQKWYREPKRALQSVHPRDIVKTAVSICNYEGAPPRLTPALLDEACRSYFVD